MKLIFFVIFISAQALDKDWIDPHNMNTKNEKWKIRNSDKNQIIMKTGDPQSCNCDSKNISNEDITFKYLKRIVNLLVQSTVVDKNNKMLRTGKFVLNMEDESYKFLIEFPTYKEIDDHKLRQLNSVLNGIFERQSIDDVFDFILTTPERFLNFILDIKTLTFFGIFVALYISYQLFRAEFSFYYILKYFIMIILIIDYGFRYQHLLEEAEIQNLKILSPSCKDMPWYTYWFSNKEDCEKKVVTPLEVALLQVRQLIVVPLSSVGTGMGELAQQLWRNLPFPWNVLIFPLMLFFIICLVAVLLSIMNELPFKINLMHLFHLELRGKSRHNNVTDEQLDKFLNAINHRPMIQSTRRSPDKKIKKVIRNKSSSLNQPSIQSTAGEAKDNLNIAYETENKSNCSGDCQLNNVESSTSNNLECGKLENSGSEYNKPDNPAESSKLDNLAKCSKSDNPECSKSNITENKSNNLENSKSKDSEDKYISEEKYGSNSNKT